MANKTLICMMGLPRSGKSTLAKKLAYDMGHPIVSRDAMRLAIHGQRYEAVAEPLIKTLDIYFIRSLFLAGHHTVICDETNYSKEAREHLKDPSWEVVYFPVLTHPDVCKERAKLTGQDDLIPVIDEMFGRYVPLSPEDRIHPYWKAGLGGPTHA